MNRYVRLLVAPAAALGAAAALWLMVGLPAWRDLPAIRRELAERRGQLEAITAPAEGTGEAQRSSQQLAGAAAALGKAGAPAGQALEIIVTLERTAEERRVTQRLQLGDAVAVGRSSWQKSEVTLEVIGPFDAVASYLADLHRLPWLLNVTQLDLRSEQDGNVRAAISGRLLWRPS